MHSSRPAPRQSSWARSKASRGRTSPNRTTSGRIGAPQASQPGTPSADSRRRSRTTPSSARSPQAEHEQVAIEPWTSTSSRVPARRWSMSTFWVITACSSPARSIRTSARWAGLGRLPSSVAKRSP